MSKENDKFLLNIVIFFSWIASYVYLAEHSSFNLIFIVLQDQLWSENHFHLFIISF